MSRGKTFFWLNLAFLGGVGLATVIDVPANLLIIGGMVGGALVIIGCRSPRPLFWGLVAILVVVGGWRYQQTKGLAMDQVSGWNDKTVTLRGWVAEDPDEGEAHTQITIQAEAVNDASVRGRVLLFAPRYPAFAYGDQLEISGRLQTPENFAEFDYQGYLSRYGIYSVMYSPKIQRLGSGQGNPVLTVILKVKHLMKDSLQRVLPEPEGGFALGILLGEQSAISEKMNDNFRLTGTAHVMAVSGYNITVVAGLLLALTKRWGRKSSFLISVSGIVLFVLLTGASASVVRAGLMGGLVLLAREAGRLSNVRNLLTVAAAVMVAVNPLILRFDIGFQLSFAAVIGLVYVSPWLEKVLRFLPKFLAVRQSLATTLSANLATLPISLVYFGRVSLYSPLINLVLLPSIPLAMGLAFGAGLAGALVAPLGRLAALPAWLVMTFGCRLVAWGAKLPGVSVTISQNVAIWTVSVYALAVVMIMSIKILKKLKT